MAGGIEFIAAVALLAVTVIFRPESANAQSMKPRDYSNALIGMNFLLLRYAYQKAHVMLDPLGSA